MASQLEPSGAQWSELEGAPAPSGAFKRGAGCGGGQEGSQSDVILGENLEASWMGFNTMGELHITSRRKKNILDWSRAAVCSSFSTSGSDHIL